MIHLVLCIQEIAGDNPKNYQIWHHRRAVVEMLGDASMEKSWTSSIFDTDPKNYHAWSHRQFVVSNFALWEGELQ